MKILIDSREQSPLEFTCETELSSLNIGDYSCILDDDKKTIPPIVIERKSLSDLFGTLTTGIKRFDEECKRAQQKGIHIIMLIEVPYYMVKQGHKFSNVSGEQILKTIDSLWLKYKINVWYCANRYEASKRVENFFNSVERRYKKKKGKGFFWDLDIKNCDDNDIDNKTEEKV